MAQPVVTTRILRRLLKTGAQFIHGFTTIAASSGLWFLVWTLHNGATGRPNSWLFVGAMIALMALAGFALWPAMTKLRSSERVVRPI